MAPTETNTDRLNWDVYVTPATPIVTRDKPPGVRDTFGQAIASTLIHGVRDAVLVDAFLMVNQAKALADWVAAQGKNLTTMYITHGHGDHWFEVGTLLERFPKARAVATRNAVKKMHQQASPDALARWQASFPGQIPDRLVIAEELEGDVIDLEGRELVAVELGHTDTDSTTCSACPIDRTRGCWRCRLQRRPPLSRRIKSADAGGSGSLALDKIELLNPRAVVASHKRPERDDDPRTIEETRQYIRDFDRLAEATTSALDLYNEMLELYPNRVNPAWALWSSARAVMSAAAAP